jgi:hypothetical protein
MIQRTRALFLVSLCLAAITATTTSEAAAKWTRTTPWACHVLQGTALDTNWALQNDSTTRELVALCPIQDTDYLLKENLDTVNVHVRDGNGSASARALLCEGNYTVAGGACSAASSSGNGFVGNTTLSPSTSGAWSTATRAYFGYVYVAIPAKTGASRSNFRGYYTAD